MINRYVTVAFLLFSSLNINAINNNDPLSEWLLLKRPLQTLGNKRMIETGLLLEKITTNQAKIAVVWAGTMPYFLDRYAIDLLGKNDKKIAHEMMRKPEGLDRFTGFYPGHLKWNYGYSIGKLRPDAIAQLWSKPEEAQPYLDENYEKVSVDGKALYLLTESDNILWDRINLTNNQM